MDCFKLAQIWYLQTSVCEVFTILLPDPWTPWSSHKKVSSSRALSLLCNRRPGNAHSCQLLVKSKKRTNWNTFPSTPSPPVKATSILFSLKNNRCVVEQNQHIESFIIDIRKLSKIPHIIQNLNPDKMCETNLKWGCFKAASRMACLVIGAPSATRRDWLLTYWKVLSSVQSSIF